MSRLGERIAEKLFLTSAVLSVTVTVLIFGFMFVLGLPLIEGGHFFDLLKNPWSPSHGLYGIYPMLVGTVAMALLSVFFAFPVSLGCACLISVLEVRIFGRFLRRVVQVMRHCFSGT